MENDSSPPSDSNVAAATTISATSSPPLASQSESKFFCKSPESQLSFSSNFISMYHSLFQTKSTASSLSPSSDSPSTSSADHHHHHLSTQQRLNQTRLILEYHQLSDHYDLCLSRLRDLADEIDSIRKENAELRYANTELFNLLSHSSQAALHNLSFSNDVNRRISLEGSIRDGRRVVDEVSGSGLSPTSVMEQNRYGKRNPERVALPKSISVRSSGYLKVNQAGESNGGPSHTSALPRVTSQLASGSKQPRVCVPAGAKTEEEALEFEVYNQGMFKTELCNKWQESGTCPYGHHCQFAHGVKELRPVIRHPKYKTEVCRMVLSGDRCSYGHRCHFRHSLTEQERMLCPR